MSRKNLLGKVVSLLDDKTVKVVVERTVMHPVYRKARKVHKKYLVRSNIPVAVGDVVQIEESRPISAKIHFVLKKIVLKAGEK